MRTLAAALFCCIAAGAPAGCSGDGARTPEAAVRAVAAAAQGGDVDALVRLLGPATRARLEVDARRAGESAGRRPLDPRELVAIGWRPPRFRVQSVRELARDGDRAQLEVRGPDGESERVDAVREAGAWHVELP